MKLRNLTLATTVVLLPSPAYADSIYFCEACQPGTYGNGKSCIDCPAGQYTSSVGSSSCTSCLTIGVETCDSTTGKATGCKAGYGFDSNSKTCTECGIGYYSAGGTNACTKCDEPTINGSENWFTYWYAKASDETINTCYSNSTTYSNKLTADDYYAQCVYDANYKQSDKVKMTLGKWKIAVERTATPECRDGCYASANAFNSQYNECVKGCESPVEQEMECGPIYGKTKTTYCTEKVAQQEKLVLTEDVNHVLMVNINQEPDGGSAQKNQQIFKIVVHVQDNVTS